jgi:hypothetical protein
MTRLSSSATPTTTQPALLVFGLDQAGKTKAGRFAAAHGETAKEAAKALKLTVLEIAGADLEELAKKVPVGRIHARGKAFIPYVKRDLYDRLAALGSDPPSGNGPAAVAKAPAAKPPASTPTVPKDWSSLTVGHLVLAKEAPAAEGWWDAVVVSRDGDTLRLAWFGYPKLPTFQRPVTAVALAHPGSI